MYATASRVGAFWKCWTGVHRLRSLVGRCVEFGREGEFVDGFGAAFADDVRAK